MNKIYDAIIIGSGPTGLYGAFFGCLKKLSVLIIEINSTYGGAPKRLYPDKPLYDIPGSIEIKGAELVENMYKQLSSKEGWEIKYNTCINQIIKNETDNCYDLVSANNETFKGKNIVFATGYGAFEFINISAPIHEKAKCKITNFISDINYYKDKKVVICGAGDSAIDYANCLKNIASNVTIIHRRNEFRAKPANVEALGDLVNFKLNYDINEVKENEIIVTHKDTNETESIPFEYILVMYGTNPLPNSIQYEGLFNSSFKIEVDQNHESIKHKGIYACGLATTEKQELTIITGIADIIRVIAKIKKELN